MTDAVPMLAPAPYVTIPLAAMVTGLTEKAIRRKIEDGKWIEGREYRRSPDGGDTWTQQASPYSGRQGRETRAIRCTLRPTRLPVGTWTRAGTRSRTTRITHGSSAVS